MADRPSAHRIVALLGYSVRGGSVPNLKVKRDAGVGKHQPILAPANPKGD